MAKKVGNPRKMSVVYSLRKQKDTSIAVYPKLRRNIVEEFKDLPTDGGNGLDGYVLNVMKLE